jgi:predicted phosphatase
MRHDEQQRELLEKLLSEKIIGAHHITETNLLKGFDRKNHGELKIQLQTLKRKGYIIAHSTRHGEALAIPSSRVAEIKKIFGLT